MNHHPEPAKRNHPLYVEPDPRAVELALDLMKLGVASHMVTELLGYEYDLIERQLAYLPFRKAKRPEAFIIDAIRRDYSPPKEFFYAPNQIDEPRQDGPVDQDAQ
jgi:hypothetical protein